MKERKVIIGINIASNAGREILSGVFSYIDKGSSWRPKLVQTEQELTPDALSGLEADGVDGYLLSFGNTGSTRDFLFRSPKPLILIGTQREGFYGRAAPTAFVWNDNAAIGTMGAKHFLSLGTFSAYAFAHSRNGEPSSLARLKGFSDTLQRAGYSLMPAFRANFHEGADAYMAAMEGWLKKLPKPAAVMAAGDKIALRVLTAAARCGITVPKQLMVIGVDNDELLVSHTSPPLTSIHPGHFEMGFKAAAELERLMSARRCGTVRTTTVPPLMIAERESTRSTPPAVTLVARANAYIKQKKSLGITAADVAAHLGCSRELIDLRFREIEGQTLRTAIENYRMNEVKHLLMTTKRPIATIARQCGFKTASHLAHLFKLRNGITMQQFREDPRHQSTGSLPSTIDIP